MLNYQRVYTVIVNSSFSQQLQGKVGENPGFLSEVDGFLYFFSESKKPPKISRNRRPTLSIPASLGSSEETR